MSGAPFVVLSVVFALGLQPPSVPKPTPQPAAKMQPTPPSPTTVSVEIVVATEEQHQANCKKGGLPSTTVLVTKTKEVFHCIGNTLLSHNVLGKDPAYGKSIVRLNAGDRLRWWSKTSSFTVVSVEPHATPGGGPKTKSAAPANPFTSPDFPKGLAAEVITSPVRDLPGTVVEQYKATFNIDGVGLVDPDFVCSM